MLDESRIRKTGDLSIPTLKVRVTGVRLGGAGLLLLIEILMRLDRTVSQLACQCNFYERKVFVSSKNSGNDDCQINRRDTEVTNKV